MSALGILAAIVVLAGGAHTAVVMSDGDHFAPQTSKQPVVQVQAIQQDDHRAVDTTAH